ncbi:MAG: glycosyltransferase [Flavobacterium sp.]|nr:glycosyltransferase [Flavobacterium sp.]
MVEINRRKIGIVFAEDESWAGGFYYLINIIKALTYLEDNKKPHIFIFLAHYKYQNQVSEIGYPYQTFVPLFPPVGYLKHFINRVTNKLFNTSIFKPLVYPAHYVDFVYPINYYSDFQSLNALKKIFWIPDFQHLHLPHNFSQETLDFRTDRIASIVSKNHDLVLSSNDAKNDFVKAHPNAKNKVWVLNFPSILPTVTKEEISLAISKFDLPNSYFLCCNQFWKHKNHIIVLEAIKILKEKGIWVFVVFTGNMKDFCEVVYVDRLERFVQENNLSENVKFLGFISRLDQLALIKGSKSVIQPSLFEGWSTIVEDCKALNHPLIISSLRVHIEQIKENALFFDPNSPNDLADKLYHLDSQDETSNQSEYVQNIKSFAEAIIKIN